MAASRLLIAGLPVVEVVCGMFQAGLAGRFGQRKRVDQCIGGHMHLGDGDLRIFFPAGGSSAEPEING